MLDGYLDWPGVGQVFELERVRESPNGTEVEVAYGITSLARQEADARRPLGLNRGHRGIENELRHARDETPGEDRRRVRTGGSPQVLAAIRNAAVRLLEGVDAPSKAAATRHFHAHPEDALPLLFT